jgi:PhzF family phenazine biosynthesis protein
MNADVLRYSAFTEDGRGGNPAGVVLRAGSLTEAQMLAIAQAIGYSETAFFFPACPRPDEASAGEVSGRLRFYSPAAEVAFCGHATIATAVALAERHGPSDLRLDSEAGPITVSTRLENGELAATLTSPPTTTRPVEDHTLNEALTTLGWTRDHLDPRYPAHVAYAGNHHLLLAVRTRDTLARLDYDYPALRALMLRERWTTAHVFWSETATVFHARDPFPPGGVVEDPATGAAAAAFGGYLRDLGLVPVPVRVIVHQGHDMGSPSRLLVDLHPDIATVEVSGTATRLALSPYDEMVTP